MKKVNLFACLSAFTFVLSGCFENSTNSDSQLEGLVAGNNNQWTKPGHIPLCYKEITFPNAPESAKEGAAEVSQKNMDSMRDYTNSQFNKAGINFTGWKECTDDFMGIRLGLNTTSIIGGRAFGIGHYMADNDVGGINLWIGFKPVVKDSKEGDNKDREEGDAYAEHYSVLLHELGHAVGLWHEMNRRDEDTCFARKQDAGRGQPILNEGSAISIGKLDRESIMNYCSLDDYIAKSKKAVLSKGDIKTLKEYYRSVEVRNGAIKKPTIALFDWYIDTHLTTGEEVKVKIKSRAGFYRFKFTEVIKNEDRCADPAGYSNPISVSKPIEYVLGEDDQLTTGKKYKLCVIGGSSNDANKGVWQSVDAASQIDFVYEKHSAIFPQAGENNGMGIIGLPLKEGKVEFSVTSKNADVTHYDLKKEFYPVNY